MAEHGALATLKDLAEKESCVIVGKCADYVLKGKPNVVSIYIEAPRAFCVNRTMENMGVTKEVANATIERTDKFRLSRRWKKPLLSIASNLISGHRKLTLP